MVVLHAADSATHVAGSWVSVVVALAGVAAGAVFVFGLPGTRRRDRAASDEPVASSDAGDDT